MTAGTTSKETAPVPLDVTVWRCASCGGSWLRQPYPDLPHPAGAVDVVGCRGAVRPHRYQLARTELPELPDDLVAAGARIIALTTQLDECRQWLKAANDTNRSAAAQVDTLSRQLQAVLDLDLGRRFHAEVVRAMNAAARK